MFFMALAVLEAYKYTDYVVTRGKNKFGSILSSAVGGEDENLGTPGGNDGAEQVSDRDGGDGRTLKKPCVQVLYYMTITTTLTLTRLTRPSAVRQCPIPVR